MYRSRSSESKVAKRWVWEEVVDGVETDVLVPASLPLASRCPCGRPPGGHTPRFGAGIKIGGIMTCTTTGGEDEGEATIRRSSRPARGERSESRRIRGRGCRRGQPTTDSPQGIRHVLHAKSPALGAGPEHELVADGRDRSGCQSGNNGFRTGSRPSVGPDLC